MHARARLVSLTQRLVLCTLALALLTAPALATWSIVVVDTKTGEVAVAGATCGTGVKKACALVRVGHGSAAAQAAGDSPPVARTIIWEGMQAGKSADEILRDIEDTLGGQIQTRQYGIVDLFSPPVTFTGATTSIATGGVRGEVGTLRYAIQGNVMTGPEVWLAAEAALLAAEGDLGQRAMAAMEAARAKGGDGRCSCSIGDPTGCGAPPAYFRRTALSCYVIVARIGDRDGICTNPSGCANGEYWLNLAKGANYQKPDPVFALQRQYAKWRLDMQGVPDQVKSLVSPTGATLSPGQSVEVVLDLLDLEGGPVDTAGLALSLEKLSAGSPVTVPSAITHLGNGIYSFLLTAGANPGSDTWRPWVETRDGKRIALQPDVGVSVAAGPR